MTGTHPEHQDFPWTIAVVDHPPRKDTPAFGRSRRLMIKLVGTLPDWVLAGEAYEDHHGGAIWVHWTDSIFNASLPLPQAAQIGVLPAGAGYHHYPKPIVDIDHFRFDDFRLFVTDSEGFPAVVVPVAPRRSGDGRVRLIAAYPGSRYVRRLVEADVVRHAEAGQEMVASGGARGTGTALLTDEAPDVLPDSDPLAREAFARQPTLHRRTRAARPKSPAIGPKRSSG